MEIYSTFRLGITGIIGIVIISLGISWLAPALLNDTILLAAIGGITGICGAYTVQRYKKKQLEKSSTGDNHNGT